MFFIFSLLYSEYICDIYLSMLDFNGKFNNIFIYKKTFSSCDFILNGLMVYRLAGPTISFIIF